MRDQLEVMGSRIMVRPTEAPTETKGGIVLPESARARTNSGTVSAVGDECAKLQLGDWVLFPMYGTGNVLEIGDERVVFMLEEDVLAFVRPTADDLADPDPGTEPIPDARPEEA